MKNVIRRMSLMKDRLFAYKQVIAVRTDLDMSSGKTAVQVAHAAVSAGERTRTMKQEVYKAWLREGQKKVAVKVGSQEELIELVRGANNMGLPYALVKDAGLTELPAGTATVVGIGPAKSKEIDRLTGHLKLL